jgi:hypothetical protein
LLQHAPEVTFEAARDMAELRYLDVVLQGIDRQAKEAVIKVYTAALAAMSTAPAAGRA